MNSTSHGRHRVSPAGRILAVVAVLIGVAGIAFGQLRPDGVEPAEPDDPVPGPMVTTSTQLTYSRLTDPPRTLVRDSASGSHLATLTDGARTAVLTGPRRTFAEPKFTDATVTTTGWVRLLPAAWTAGAERQPWFGPWFSEQIRTREPDVLDVATQYLYGQPEARDAAGVRYRGDASFGPLSEFAAATRQENSDFYDYLGRDWVFSDTEVERADPTRYGNVDCSGYLRLVYGYRMGIPLQNSNAPGSGLPRRAFAIAEYAPGTVIIPDRQRVVDDYSRLQPGDLVFFNIDREPQMDHSGIYLGVDDVGHHRFLSSRGRADGPTIGDLGGTSLLDDGGYYSRTFRTARRL